jgi:hypothetical protein
MMTYANPLDLLKGGLPSPLRVIDGACDLPLYFGQLRFMNVIMVWYLRLVMVSRTGKDASGRLRDRIHGSQKKLAV